MLYAYFAKFGLICLYLWPKYGRALISSGDQLVCPPYGLQSWADERRKLNCSPLSNYHCAKEYNGNWKEVCDRPRNCTKGEEPQVTRDDRIVCAPCKDSERYNPNPSTVSNEFSECEQRKTLCDRVSNGRIECTPTYDSSDPNAHHKQDRKCRCDYENGYRPVFYQENDKYTCREAQELECKQYGCPDGKKMQSDYRCYPVPTTKSATKGDHFDSKVPEVSKELITKATSTPMNTSDFVSPTARSTTHKTNGDDEEGDGRAVMIAVIVTILTVVAGIVIAVVLLWKCYKKKPASENDCVPLREDEQTNKPTPDKDFIILEPGPVIQRCDLSTDKILKPTSPEVEGIFKTVLGRNTVNLKENLRTTTIDHIKQYEIGVESQHMNIEDATRRYDRNGLIVDLIRTHGFESYMKFKEILQKTKQIPLLNDLENTEKTLLKDGDSLESERNEAEMEVEQEKEINENEIDNEQESGIDEARMDNENKSEINEGEMDDEQENEINVTGMDSRNIKADEANENKPEKQETELDKNVDKDSINTLSDNIPVSQEDGNHILLTSESTET